MFVTMPISLYTSRLVLEALGVESYGVYNVVGGVVSLFSILSGALSVSISRYLTFQIGQGDYRKLNVLFSTSINIQIFLAVLISIIAEFVGVWFLNSQMNIPSEMIDSANWVFQCSLITFIIGIISVPYNALIVAHERMSAFAYIGIIECFLKLGISFVLLVSSYDRLVLYALLLMMVSVTMRFIYGKYCTKHFPESKYHFVLDKALIKNMFNFIGWAFWGNGVVVLKDQGTSILLNIFGGPVINAAQGVAAQVNGVVNMFVNNFMMAVHPQITKAYSSSDLHNMHKLIIVSSKMSFFILLLLFVPLSLNIDFVLSLWLVDVPVYTSHFVIILVAISLMQCFNQPLLTGVLAEGNIKKYEITLTFLYFINFLVNFLVLKRGFAPYVVYVMNGIFVMVILFVLLKQAHDKYQFPVIKFCTVSLGISMIVATFCVVASFFLRVNVGIPLANAIFSALLQFLCCVVIIIFLGFNKRERSFVFSSIKSKLKK